MPFELPQTVGVLLPLVVLLVLIAMSRFALRWVIAFVFGRQAGEHALAKQPGEIHLHPAGVEPWREPGPPTALRNDLVALGFRDAGTHGIDEMPDVRLQLFAHESGESWAALYEHTRAGVWFDVYSHGESGGSFTMSTTTPTGLDAQPDRPVVHAPGASPADVWMRFLHERPAGAWRRVTVADAVPAFERAWTEGLAWRRAHGVSRREAIRVSQRRAA